MDRFYKPKSFPNYELISGTVSGTGEYFEYKTENCKSAFELIDKDGKKHKCVYWAVFEPKDGEKVTVKGFTKITKNKNNGIINKVFIVKTLLRGAWY